MIYVVIKNKNDVQSFANLLEANGYIYKRKMARIFLVNTDLDSFSLKGHSLVESLGEPNSLNLTPFAETTIITENNIRVRNGHNYVATLIDSWARHRIIRRFNPFREQADEFKEVFELPYYQTRTGVGVDVYTMDIGVDPLHPEYVNKTITTLNPPEEEIPTNGHGVRTAGYVIGDTCGMAPNANLFFLHDDLYGDLDALVTEADWAVKFDILYQHYLTRAYTDNPAVVYLSLGTLPTDNRESSELLVAVLTDMCEAGMTVCIAGGNSGVNLDIKHIAPVETIEDTIGVGATSYLDYPYWIKQAVNAFFPAGTSVGDAIDIYAPGQGVRHPIGDTQDYRPGTGTSYACPLTAGVVACMLEGYRRPTSIEQVRNIKKKLLSNATKGALRIGDSFYGDSSVTTIHDRLLYLEPKISIEHIEGLVLR